MAQPKQRPATYADIEALPPGVKGEIVAGVLHTQPQPAPRHNRAAGELALELGSPFGRGRGGPGGLVFLPEPELHLAGDVVVPDIAGWKRERLPALPKTTGIRTAPDWLCEILSPSTQRFDRTDKLTLYAQHGVNHCWNVDPQALTLEVFERQDRKWLLAATFKDDDMVAAPPFAVHAFSLGVLWMPEQDTPQM
jgi:Uma2 family endonuclease